MVPESSRASYVLTFLMTAIAGTATEIAVVDTRSVWTSVGLASIWVALTLFVGAILRPRQVRAD
jgi:membrane protease YdiL (CAAX protease family)